MILSYRRAKSYLTLTRLEKRVEYLSEKQAQVRITEMDFLPKLNSFFGMKLELGIKIFSLVLAILGWVPPSCILTIVNDFYDNTSIWITQVPIPINLITFGLAFFAVQWNKTTAFLLPAAVLAHIWSLVSVVCFIVMLVLYGDIPYTGVIVPLVFLLDSILLAYYWVGLMTLYIKKSTNCTVLTQTLEI